MGLGEPNNELYAAVKAIADPWPPDDEDAVGRLGQAWRTAGDAASQASSQVENSAHNVSSAWWDPAGSLMATKLAGGAQSLRQTGDSAGQLAAMAERYAQELVAAKTAIIQVIAQNLPLYLQLAAMPGGAVAQTQLATAIAGQLRQMVQAKAAALGGAAPAVPAPAPAPAAAAKKDDVLGEVGDWAGAISAVAGFAALFPPLAPFFAPAAALSGGVALIAHTIDAAANKPDDRNAWVGVAGDAVGMIPGVRAVGAALDRSRAAADVLDFGLNGFNVILQGPTVAGAFTDSPVIDDLKDQAGAGGLGNNVASMVKDFAR